VRTQCGDYCVERASVALSNETALSKGSLMRVLSVDGETFLKAARDLAPEIVAVRDDIESACSLPKSLVEKMRSARMFELWLPQTFGGPALHPLDFLPIIEELSGADGSAGWCATIGSVYSLLAGNLNEAAAREIFVDRAIVAGSVNPTGKAVVVDDGYRVSGRWGYGSGIKYGEWTLGNCIVHDETGPRRLPSGAPEMLFMFFPTAEVEVIDTWRVGGLRGTGSHDFAVDNLFVPARRAMQAFAATGVQAGTLYRMPILSLFCFALAAVTLGIARSALNEFVKIATAKIPMGSQTLLRDRPSAQSDVARAGSMVRAARAGLVEAVGAQGGDRRGPPGVACRARRGQACDDVCGRSLRPCHRTRLQRGGWQRDSRKRASRPLPPRRARSRAAHRSDDRKL
jgi:indole-3-acetate monooxygenase